MEQKYDPVERFNKRSRIYDKDIDSVIPGYPTIIDLSYYILRNSLPKKARILVAGSGTGNEAIRFAKVNPGWNVTGFDLSDKMIEVANRKLNKSKLNNRINFIHGDITKIKQRSFDSISSILVMHFIEEKEFFLNEVFNRLKKGGIFILVDINGNKKSEQFKYFLNTWKKFQLDKRKDPEQVNETFTHIENNLKLISERKTLNLLKKGGFKNPIKFFQSLLISGYVITK